jgi:tRNA uridine 5-carbamoylmethylation protein Kti12
MEGPMLGAKTLIAMMGLPRSGKSTIARSLSKALGAPIVSRDALRLAVHGQRYEGAAEPLIRALDIYMVRALFGAGHETVIVDETNYSPEARAHLEDPNWEIQWYPVLTHPDLCKERAKATNQPDLLPVIDEMFTRYVKLPKGARLYYNWAPVEWAVHDTVDNRRNPSNWADERYV